MMSIPVPLIAFFLATLLLPPDVDQFTINVNDNTIQWTRQEGSWKADEQPNDSQINYSVAKHSVVLSKGDKERKTDMSQYLAVPSDLDTANVTEIPVAQDSWGSAIRIQREKNRIILSQSSGSFFEEPVTITW